MSLRRVPASHRRPGVAIPPRPREWLEVIVFIAVVALIWIAVPVQARVLFAGTMAVGSPTAEVATR
jgi:hypothetical protein